MPKKNRTYSLSNDIVRLLKELTAEDPELSESGVLERLILKEALSKSKLKNNKFKNILINLEFL